MYLPGTNTQFLKNCGYPNWAFNNSTKTSNKSMSTTDREDKELQMDQHCHPIHSPMHQIIPRFVHWINQTSTSQMHCTTQESQLLRTRLHFLLSSGRQGLLFQRQQCPQSLNERSSYKKDCKPTFNRGGGHKHHLLHM